MDERAKRKSAYSQAERSGTSGKAKQSSPGDKLKNETTAGEAMRKKFRHGKKDNSLTREELKAEKRTKKQGRRKAYAEVAAVSGARREIIQNEDDNAGTKALNTGLGIAETGLYETRKNHYSHKLHQMQKLENGKQEQAGKQAASAKEGSHAASKAAQKNRMKKEFESAAHKKQAAENANRFGSISQKFVDKAEELTGMLAEFVKEHPTGVLIAAVILLVVVLIMGCLSSCSMVAGGAGNATIASSYTAKDADILAVDADYTEKETELQERVDRIESDYPGYDEYRYTMDSIGHNPFQLAAVLTVLYEDYTEAEVQSRLQSIFDAQYSLSIRRIVEIRTRTETRTGHRTIHHLDGTTTTEEYTYEVEVEYEYYILQTTLTNHTLDTVIRGMGLTSEQMTRYELLLETYGNKAYLFGDDIYSVVDPGEYTDYDIPPEALTDQKFANMIQEAEKYLGYPYVWGGSSPSTSFDCSGFVCYVLNHCGNGWSVGRQTANGLLGKCTRVSASEAKPGDLIFFQGTYNTSGASHVGIYVGNGMMLHCGNPIQYTSINTSYWQDHFYTYARIN